MKNVFAVIGAAALLTVAASAASTVTVSGITPTLGGDTRVQQVKVSYNDVNPADAAGATALLARLQKAGDAVCTTPATRSSTILADKIAKCRADAIAQAVKDIDAPALTAAAQAK